MYRLHVLNVKNGWVVLYDLWRFRLKSRVNYSATSYNTKLLYWPLMDGLLYLVQRGGAWTGCGPAHPLLAVPNVTAHPSTTSVPITVLLYDGPLLCGFNVAIKRLRQQIQCQLPGTVNNTNNQGALRD